MYSPTNSSNVILDPDWNNEAVIVDCSISKKRKQEELDCYASFAVKKKEQEELYGGDVVQTPPPGTLEIGTSKLGRVHSIVPRINIKFEHGTVRKHHPTVWGELRHPKLGGTVIPIRNYTKHYTCPDYVTLVHQKVVGLIKQWRKMVMEIVRELEEWDYSW
jgi:hypothetical protein